MSPKGTDVIDGGDRPVLGERRLAATRDLTRVQSDRNDLPLGDAHLDTPSDRPGSSE